MENKMKTFELSIIGYTNFGLDSYHVKVKAENMESALKDSETLAEIENRIKIGMWIDGDIDNAIEINK